MRPGPAVFATEMRSLLRDRRALFLAVVLPMLLYPALFAGLDRFEGAARRSVEERPARVGHDLGALPEALRARLLESWLAPERHLELFPLADAGLALDGLDELAALPPAAGRARWAGLATDLALAAHPADDGGFVLRGALDGSDTLSRSAAERVASAVDALDLALLGERLEALGGDPAAALALEERDVARAEDASARELGELLPFLAVLMLLSGGSFAALGAFAGEREAGTLETLLVAPVAAPSIARGKLAAVLATALAALAGNALSFLACQALGLGRSSFLPRVPLAVLGGRLALGLALFLPCALLLSALLCLISARARSFREGQHYLLPLLLVSIAPASLSMAGRVELGWLLALVPIAGSALALRDALAGHLAPGPAAAALAAGSAWALLALSGIARTLDAERLLATRAPRAEHGARRAAARSALAWGALGAVILWAIGGRLQAWRLAPGLALTLAVLLPALTAIALARQRALQGPAAAPPRALLGLRRPSLRAALGGLALGPGLALVTRGLHALQARVLPLPRGLAETALELAPALSFALLCALPAVSEELFFRGVLLHGLRRDRSPARSLLVQAALFAASHGSLYRLVPSAVAGLALGGLALGTGSIAPAMLAHLGHNAWLLWGGSGLAADLGAGALGAVGLGLLARRAR